MKSKQTFETLVERELDERVKKQILYAAAFIFPGIVSVSYDKGVVCFLSEQHISEAKVSQNLDKLIERFSGAKGFETEILFQRTKTGIGRGIEEITELMKAGIIQQTHQGIFLWREPLSLFLKFLDEALVQKFARPFKATEEKYPNVISFSELAKTNHLSSFPEHLNFVSNIKPDLDTLDSFGKDASSLNYSASLNNKILNTPELIHNPSTCYHCYASRAGKKIDANMAVTALASCHRYESANHRQLGRLMEFSLREVIFLGAPEFVRDTREKCLNLIEAFAEEWEIGGVLQSENDPFFTSDFEIKADHQRKMKMKYEFRAFLSEDDDGLAIMSSNLHGLTFSKNFKIKNDVWPVHTGCIGFGLERMAIAIISQHGLNSESWPMRLQTEWEEWLDFHKK